MAPGSDICSDGYRKLTFSTEDKAVVVDMEED